MPPFVGYPIGARVAVVAALLAACEEGAPIPAVKHVFPAAAYSDRDLRVTITGGGFVPSYRIDSASGTRIAVDRGFSGTVGHPGATFSLRDLAWRGPTELSATIPAGLPPGAYAIKLVDPRGRTANLPAAFTALGPDAAPPDIVFDGPDGSALAAPGLTINVAVRARDGAPGRLASLSWEVIGPGGLVRDHNDCAIDDPATEVTCRFETRMPDDLRRDDVVEIQATAVDDAATPNRARASIYLRLRDRPDITRVSPEFGGAAGGTDVVIFGSGFLPGSRAFFGPTPLVPDGGFVLDEHTITGRAPPGVPGPVRIRVQTPLGAAVTDGDFAYHAPPHLDGVEPTFSPEAGGQAMRLWGTGFTSNTRVYVGDQLATAVPLQDLRVSDDQEIRGTSPPGMGRTSIWAYDADFGWSRLSDAFAWVP